MRKEVIFAILLGLGLAGLFLYGLYLSQQASQKANNQKKEEPKTQAIPTPPPQSQHLTIISPANHTVSFKDTITIKGQAGTNAPIAIISEEDEIIIQANDQGIFEQEVSLVGGENIITVATPGKNETLQKIITIIHTTAEIDLEDQKQASSEAQLDVADQVKGVIDSIIKGESAATLVGLTGIVETINDQVISINSEDNLYQVSIKDDTDILDGKKDVDLSGIAIDDKLIVIGVNQDNQFVIQAARIIIVSNQAPITSRQALYGTVKEVAADDDLFTLTPAGQGQDEQIELPRKYDLDLTELTIGSSLLLIVEKDSKQESTTLLTHQIL